MQEVLSGLPKLPHECRADGKGGDGKTWFSREGIGLRGITVFADILGKRGIGETLPF
jgi:hypothetical protein